MNMDGSNTEMIVLAVLSFVFYLGGAIYLLSKKSRKDDL